jgi:hypothetical protein
MLTTVHNLMPMTLKISILALGPLFVVDLGLRIPMNDVR